ncbi:phosphotransferase enzyme family protein [Spirillospora sp. NPDC048911]|uniref:phosphotransferase enzyme family protein n=1 Tax=Spirillospora sp. NPDC048911 TaxID=3364527 RepID=UPI003710A6B2
MGRAASFAEVAVEAARAAARRAGLESQALELVRVGDRAVLRLDGGRVIARVGRSLDLLESARREVQVARWLHAEGIAVTRPLEGEQPLVMENLPVSLWHAVDGDWTVPVDLAAILRRLHSLTPPADLVLPQLDPFERVDERIDAAPAITVEERHFLRSMAVDLRERLQNVRYALDRSVLHGDANIGNVLKTPGGEVVLFDLGGMCWGPPEWDLSITAVYRDLGWHTDAEYAAFCQVYGFDVAEWPGYPALRAVKELRMTCWLSQKAGDDEQIAQEVRRRIGDLADPERARNWHPY